MRRIRSAIQVACLLAICAGLPALSGCGESEATTAPPKIDQVQAKSAEEATAKAHEAASKAKPQTKHY